MLTKTAHLLFIAHLLVASNYCPGQPKPADDMQTGYIECIKNMKPGAFEVRFDPPAINRLSSIDAPTLVIAGDLDLSEIIEIVDLIVKDVKDAQKITIKGAAHLVNMEKTVEFNRALISYITV